MNLHPVKTNVKLTYVFFKSKTFFENNPTSNHLTKALQFQTTRERQTVETLGVFASQFRPTTRKRGEDCTTTMRRRDNGAENCWVSAELILNSSPRNSSVPYHSEGVG